MKEMTLLDNVDLKDILQSIFECNKEVKYLESELDAIKVEMALLFHLELAFKLIDRGTDL